MERILQDVSEFVTQAVISVHTNGLLVISHIFGQHIFPGFFVVLKALLTFAVGFLPCHSFIRVPLAIVEDKRDDKKSKRKDCGKTDISTIELYKILTMPLGQKKKQIICLTFQNPKFVSIFTNSVPTSHNSHCLVTRNSQFTLFREINVVYSGSDRLCGLVIRASGYRSRGPGSILGATRYSEKQWFWNEVHSAS
jgi:hypothetical protein